MRCVNYINADFFSCGIIFRVYENFKPSITGTFKHTLYYFLQLHINLFITIKSELKLFRHMIIKMLNI